MKVITSFSKKLYEQYAHKVVSSFHLWPEEAKLIIYSEDMSGYNSDRIEWRPLAFSDLDKFKAEAPPNPRDYTRDAAKFANKIWAMVEGTKDETDLCFWLDADCITHRPIPSEFLKRLIAPSYYLASFQRPSYVETGFWCVRAKNVEHKAFMRALKDVYTSGHIYKLNHWHDCYALDYAREITRVRSVNLTKTLGGKGTHVIASSELGRFIDHTKGDRKVLGYSPECRWHRPLLGDGVGSDNPEGLEA